MTNAQVRRKTENRTTNRPPHTSGRFDIRASDFFRHWPLVIPQQVAQRFRADKDTEPIFVRPESLGKSVRFVVPMREQMRKSALHESDRRTPVRPGDSVPPGGTLPNGSSALRLTRRCRTLLILFVAGIVGLPCWSSRAMFMLQETRAVPIDRLFT